MNSANKTLLCEDGPMVDITLTDNTKEWHSVIGNKEEGLKLSSHTRLKLLLAIFYFNVTMLYEIM